MPEMRRRQFITSVAGAAAAAWPIAVRAQEARLRTIGFLGAASNSAWREWAAAFAERLGGLGWVEGRSIAIEYRWADGRSERFDEIAAEFAKLKVDVIVTSGSAVLAAKRVTSVIPIVFAVAVDPVAGGLVATLRRPGGNVTGLSIQATDLAGKRIELLREILPRISRLGILTNVGYPAAAAEMTQVEATARTLGLEVVTAGIRGSNDIAPAFEALKGRVDGLYVVVEPLVITNGAQINGLAVAARLPTVSGTRDFAAAGGLMSYGPNFPHLFRRAADLVDKVLRGANPADIPVEQPTKFDLVLNLKTAAALKLDLPWFLNQRADEVIE